MSDNQETLFLTDQHMQSAENKSLDKSLAGLRAYKKIKFVANRKATIIVVGAFLLILLAIPILNKNQQLAQYREQYIEASEQLSALHKQETALSNEVEMLKDDEYIAKLVRSEYGVSKGNELVFKFPSNQEAQHRENLSHIDAEQNTTEDE